MQDTCPEVCCKADLKSTATSKHCCLGVAHSLSVVPLRAARAAWTHTTAPPSQRRSLTSPPLGHLLLIPGLRRVFLTWGHEPVPELRERAGGSCFLRLCLPRGRGVLAAGKNETLPTLLFVCLAPVDYIFCHLQKVILNLYLVILLASLCIFFLHHSCVWKHPQILYIPLCVCVCVCVCVVSAWYVYELKTFSSPLVPGHLTLMGLEMTNVNTDLSHCSKKC